MVLSRISRLRLEDRWTMFQFSKNLMQSFRSCGPSRGAKVWFRCSMQRFINTLIPLKLFSFSALCLMVLLISTNKLSVLALFFFKSQLKYGQTFLFLKLYVEDFSCSSSVDSSPCLSNLAISAAQFSTLSVIEHPIHSTFMLLPHCLLSLQHLVL